MAPTSDDDGKGGGSDQSEPMGRSDDSGEEEVPMKGPADDGDGNGAAAASRDVDSGEGGAGDGEEAADESFLDDDFLSFDHADNGGSGDDGPGRKRGCERVPPCPPARPTVPWLDESAASHRRPPPPPPSYPQQEPWGRGPARGYGGGGRYPPPPPPPVPISPLIRLHNEIVSFANLMSPTEGELEERRKMVGRVTEMAHRIFGGKDKRLTKRISPPQCEVLPFGSQVTGLCLPGSDIDLVIRFAKRDPGGKSEEGEDFGNPLHRFADAVREEFGVPGEFDATDNGEGGNSEGRGECLSYLEVIEQTRVPLVKFAVAPYGIDVDVCFDQPNGPESAALVHRFMESMPPLRPLTFVLKYFLASREINKPFSGGIGSYLLQLMIVSYLQHRAREDASKGHGASGKHFNLGCMLLEFFEFYGLDFNYVTTGVSVRHDGYYFPKGGRDRRNSFWQPSRPFALAMENPLDATADVGAGAFRMQMIQRIFAHAFKTLLAYVSEPAEPTESILATIIPPTEEMAARMEMKRGLGESKAREVDDDRMKGKRDSREKDRHRKRKRRDERRDERRRHSDDSRRGKDKHRKEKRRSR
ncbi:hypothetical protein ACHAWF_008248 [Thalassiosira exigua]